MNSQFNGFNWQIDLESEQIRRDSVWNNYKIIEIGGPAEYAAYKAVQIALRDKDAKQAMMVYQAKKNNLVTQITSDEQIDISKDMEAEEKRQKNELLYSKTGTTKGFKDVVSVVAYLKDKHSIVEDPSSLPLKERAMKALINFISLAFSK